MTTVREKRGYGLLVWQMTSIITIIRSYRSINDDGSCENYISYAALDKWTPWLAMLIPEQKKSQADEPIGGGLKMEKLCNLK